MALSARDRLLIAAHAIVSERTVIRAYAGAPSLSTTRERICAAAQQLGLPMPPPAAENAKAA